jgi:alkanesulfonate monooxygenase SsuD/methylene tetrahydromethanopterin reductase-like flavin-dependent oxidoreductase (luciferase family)
MSRPFRFAILHHLEGEEEEAWPTPRAYGEIVAQVEAAEALGYSAVWFAEHHFGGVRGRAPNPLLLIVRAAATTSRIRLGPAVLLTPYYHPLRLAEDVAMADVLSGGRLNAGFSSGSIAAEAMAFGVDLSAKHEGLTETLAFLRAAWTGEPVAPNPDSPPVTVVPRPLQPWDELVWVAASSHGAAAVAGACGAHLLLPSLKTVAQSAAHADTYRRALSDAGHDPATREVQVTLHAWIDADRERALAEGLPLARRYAERYHASGAVPAIPNEPFAETMERMNFVVGDAADLRAAVAHRREALGLTQIALQLRMGGMSHARTLRAMEDIAAALRNDE